MFSARLRNSSSSPKGSSVFQQVKGMDYLMVPRNGRKEAKGEKERGKAIAASTSTELLDSQAVTLCHTKSNVIVTHTLVSE